MRLKPLCDGPCPLWVVSGHRSFDSGAAALFPKADISGAAWNANRHGSQTDD
jgi:hypothetical protein